jgi:AcrR family transcriptional regulator
MGKEKQDTKQAILDTALDLFSKRGYSAVSIRDICSRVGLKESAIYYHFKNKQDIFDILCQSFDNVMYSIPPQFAKQMAKVTKVDKEAFLMVCNNYFTNYLMEERVNKFLRMLIIEQGINEVAAKMYHNIMFDEAVSNQILIFSWLTQLGFLRTDKVERMVMDYHTMVVYLFHRYLICGEITDEVKLTITEELSKHIDYFLEKYGTNKEMN